MSHDIPVGDLLACRDAQSPNESRPALFGDLRLLIGNREPINGPICRVSVSHMFCYLRNLPSLYYDQASKLNLSPDWPI